MSEEFKKAFLKDDHLIIFLTVLEVVVALAWGIIISFVSLPLAIVMFLSLTTVALVINNNLLNNRPADAIKAGLVAFRKRHF